MAYSGRLAVIAGGLGGLGTATAKLLLSNGARVALLHAPFETPRRDSILASTYDSSLYKSSSSSNKITTYECDITSESSVTSAFQSLSTSFNNSSNDIENASFPSILINAAGYVTVQAMEDTSSEEAVRNIMPNLLGPFNTSRAFHKLYTESCAAFRKNANNSGGKDPPPGRIFSISSQAAHVALWGHSAYCASKAGLNGLTRCMAVEWAPQGITSNTVSPTVVLTELGKKAWKDDMKRKEMEGLIPTGRFATPEEIASAVEWLCRDESGMVNGADLRVDGGFTIR